MYKTSILKDWLYNNNVDICGLQETGIAQHMFQRFERLSERMRDNRRENIRMCSANDRHESIEKLQYGGTAVFAYDYVSHLVHSSDADETGLGRWAWVQYRGKHKIFACVISAYQPHKSNDDRLHPKSVYRQQQ